MYYLKDPHTKTRPLQINFDNAWRELDFRDFITYPDNRHALLDWMQQHPSGAPDLAAAVFTQINYRRPLNELIERALDYCGSMIEAAGYESVNLEQLANLKEDHLGQAALVPGCQGKQVFRSRVEAAFSLVDSLPYSRFTVVFSGRNPDALGKGLKIQTSNEALKMQSYFYSLLKQRGSKFKTEVATYLENASSNSVQNIVNFFSGDYIRRDIPSLVYIVSSTFHMPRLLRIVEAEVKKDPSLKRAIKKIVAVTAEDGIKTNPVVKSNGYVKWMMYEVFEHLLLNSKHHHWPAKRKKRNAHPRAVSQS